MSKAPATQQTGDYVVRSEKDHGIRPACVQGPNKEKHFVSNEKFKFYIPICRETVPCQKRGDGDQIAIPKRSLPFGRDEAGGTKPKDRHRKGHFSNQDAIRTELELTVGMRRGRLK